MSTEAAAAREIREETAAATFLDVAAAARRARMRMAATSRAVDGMRVPRVRCAPPGVGRLAVGAGCSFEVGYA